ncbi:HAD-IA family hydrolase [Acidisphaera sp. S103]|uniref:HAD-IA family hydrolase n=1 Tax=Acidisphaera sp. S103 TaxID=1747223 RepID=UPI0020B10F11|nr:HAD-IA family hydrolase [Acidisphaera sp. S103]
MARTLLLDLDGTLVDTVPDLTSALNRLMAARGLPEFTRRQVAAMVGDGVAVLVARAFAAHDRQPDAAAVADLTADYTANVAVESALYPEVLPVLTRLAADGWHLAVCTNKPEQAARMLLGALGLLPLLCAIGGGDSFPTRKPDPAHLLATLTKARGQPSAALMLGDHHNDVVAARGAGMPSIFAGWGYGSSTMAEGCTAVAYDITEAALIANQLLSAAL